MNNRPDIKAPPFYSLALTLGRPFGVRWVGDYELAVIYQLERYHEVKGPGFFVINPLTQRVHSVISISPDFITTPMSSIQTKDALQLDFSVALAYSFAPQSVPKERAAMVVKWSRDIRRAIVTDNAQRAFQAVVPKFYAEQICRGEVFKPLEEEFLSILTTRLEALALKPVLGMVREVKVPAVLQSRFEAVVQRRVDVDDLRDARTYEPYVLTQHMRTAALEAMQGMMGGKMRVDVAGLTDEVLPSRGEGQSRPPQIARPDATSGEPISRLRPRPPQDDD